MRNENLYKYLTSKCKERKVPIESMPELFGFSRSSLYRYMKGIIRMTPEVRAKFVCILDLNESERQEFERLVGLSEFDSTMIASRYALDNFVFCKQVEKEKPEVIKFAYHENDTFLRTSSEIYELIQSLAVKPGALCKIRVINCLKRGIFDSVSFFLEKLFSISESIIAEHLLTFSEKDHLHNTNTLINIIPLLKYKCYSVYHSKTSVPDEFNALFGDSIIVEVQHKGSPKYFFISYLDEDLSACLATSDKNVFAFVFSNYEAFKKSYNAALLDADSLDLFGSKIAELQENTNCYLLKPNCCYDRIPITAYQHMISRASSDELKNVQKGLVSTNDEGTQSLEVALSILEKRIASSFKNHYIDVYSVGGLTRFTETGRITDHLDFLPSFNKEERQTILEYIRNRYLDPNDKFTLYITKEEIFENGYIILAYEGVGVLIEYNQDNYRQGICSNLFIKNKLLANVISDYVKNHVPNNHALNHDGTIVLLNKLIKSLM